MSSTAEPLPMRFSDVLLTTIIVGFLHGKPVYAHVSVAGQDAGDSTSQTASAADPIGTLPRMLQNEVRHDLETRRNAVQRFLIVLNASDAQRKGMIAEHERLIEQYTAALPPLAAEADELLDELISRVPETQPFKKRAAGEALSPRERIQIQRYLAAIEAGVKANALMGTELAEEARAIDNNMRTQMRNAWRLAFEVFLASVQGVLTEVQAERMYAAVHAYACQPYRSEPERTAGPPSRMLHGETARWIDARMLLDPRIEPMSDLPQQAVALREHIADRTASSLLTEVPAIAALIEQYEARQVQCKRQVERMHERDSATMDDVIEAITDEQQGRWTIDLQQQVQIVLAEEASPAMATLWIDATNRLIHRGVYRRWDRIDHEFDAAIERTTAAEDPDEDQLEPLRALRAQYKAETDVLEQQLIAASQATMGINPLRPDAQKASEKDALRTLREQIEHAIHRRAWYRQRIDELCAGGTIKD